MMNHHPVDVLPVLPVTDVWKRLRNRLGIHDVELDYDLGHNRFFSGRSLEAPVHLWMGLARSHEYEGDGTILRMGYSEKPDIEPWGHLIACPVLGPPGVARLDLSGDLWPGFVLEMVQAMQSCLASPDWDDQGVEGSAYFLVRQTADSWAGKAGLFESGQLLATDPDLIRKCLIRNARDWNGDIDRLVYTCYADLSFRTSPKHIQASLENVLPDILGHYGFVSD